MRKSASEINNNNIFFFINIIQPRYFFIHVLYSSYKSSLVLCIRLNHSVLHHHIANKMAMFCCKLIGIFHLITFLVIIFLNPIFSDSFVLNHKTQNPAKIKTRN